MVLAERVDEFGRGGWIVATVLGFWLFWPVGLAVLAFLWWSGRLRGWRWCCESGDGGRRGDRRGGPWSWGGGFGDGAGWRRRQGPPPSGNQAFDEYRAETLRRLEAEQREFVEYLERLRRARDKAEFDQFMAERRPHAPATPEPDQR